ncbi:MAG: hypothetical protein FWG81_04100 [Betaproteobacteria bacterium]|nr:hypothetical protein [Betaproteobacteria bacterium]
MGFELARFVAAKAFRCSAELTDLVPLLKEFVSDGDEYKTYAKAIALVSAQIDLVLLKELYANIRR